MLNFIKGKPIVLAEYGIIPSRILADGDGVIHFELSNPIWMMTKSDTRIQYWSDEALTEYIDKVIGE